MRQKPKRAPVQRWLEGAPPYVLCCQDNGGKTADRYTIWFEATPHEGVWWIPYLALSDNPTHPQGVSLCGEMPQHHATHRGRDRVRWLDLPEHIRNHAIRRYEGD